MGCPLCDHPDARRSWLGSVFFEGRPYTYVDCLSCHSLYCDPMPAPELVARLFGPAFAASISPDSGVADPKEPQRVVEWLRGRTAGSFIDYGCGGGSLLVEAAKLGWRATGVEFDAEVARATQHRTGAPVVDRLHMEPLVGSADALHLGDVIGHLTEMNREMPGILRLLKPGGFLLAQGPLEANPNLFTLVLRLARSLRRSRRTQIAPYHVLLATSPGQCALFRRFGLHEVDYAVKEVAWPAPSRLSLAGPSVMRPVGLFLLRRLSQAISAFRPGRWGNRYYYVGQWGG